MNQVSAELLQSAQGVCQVCSPALRTLEQAGSIPLCCLFLLMGWKKNS